MRSRCFSTGPVRISTTFARRCTSIQATTTLISSKNMNIYIDMLQDIGILVDDRHECDFKYVSQYELKCTVCGETKNSKVDDPSCCGEVMQQKNGHLVCHKCARCVVHSERIWYWPYAQEGKRTNCGYTMKKYRPYKKTQYFLNHLKRYEGSLCNVKEPWVADMFAEVNPLHRDAYFHVRSWLLKHKKTKYYGHIFTMIYDNGGRRPDLSVEAYRRLKDEIKAVCHYHDDVKYRGEMLGHSMKCVPAMLHKLLILSGHEPYYNLHQLKDQGLMEKVDRFFEMYVANVVNKRRNCAFIRTSPNRTGKSSDCR